MGSTQSTWGQIKNIKLHIVTNIKGLKMEDDWGMPESGAELAVETPIEDIKLFGKWNPDEVQVSDISLTDYIAVKEKNAVYLPRTAARYAVKRFRKAQCPIVERLVNSLMMHGRNNGKKLMTARTPPVSEDREPSGDRLSTCLLSVESTRLSGFCAPEPVRPPSETPSPSPSVSPTS